MLRNLWRIAGKVFLVALVLDAIYQITVFHWFYPLQALIVATLIVSMVHRRQSAEKKNMSRTDSTDDSGKPEITHHYDNSMRLREGK